MINCIEFPLGLSRGHTQRFILQETVEWLLSSNQIQNKSSTLLLMILMIYHVQIYSKGDVIICKCNKKLWRVHSDFSSVFDWFFQILKHQRVTRKVVTCIWRVNVSFKSRTVIINGYGSSVFSIPMVHLKRIDILDRCLSKLRKLSANENLL